MTGGLGFIGSNVALALAAVGVPVTVIDAGYERHGANAHNLDGAAGPIEVIATDVGDAGAVRDAVAGAKLIFNLAGQVSHLDSMSDPQFDLDVNTRSQLAFLEVLRKVNPHAVVVYTSTRQVFGKPRYLPVDEEHPISPVDVNGVSKYAAEQFHLLYAERYGLRATAVRLTNVYGPRQRLRDDFQGFLPIFIRRALDGETITVFGEGEQQRDCLYVDDVTDCLVRAAVSPDASGEAFNVGHEEHLSLRQIAEIVVATAGSGTVESVPWPPDRDAIDIGSYFADPSKSKRVLGWEPATSFRDGMACTMAFYRSHWEWYR